MVGEYERLFIFLSVLTLHSVDTRFNTSTRSCFWKKNVGKGEIASNEQFLLFPQCCLLKQIIVSTFVHIYPSYLYFSADELEESKIGI